jgi:signal peptidase I
MARNRGQQAGSPPRSDEPPGPEPGLIPRLVSRLLWVFGIAAVVIPLVAARAAVMRFPEGSAFGATFTAVLAALLGSALLEGGLVWVFRFLLGTQFDEARRRHRAVKESKLLCQESRRILRKHSYRIKPELAREIAGHQEALRGALKERSFETIRVELGTLDDLVDRHLAFARKSTVREYAESIGVAVLIALLLRSFVVEAFKIPSGSMIPTLQVGDHIFVNKFIYGLGYPLSGEKFWIYSAPKRGDVIVFKYPEDKDKDFIKRVIGIAGDSVAIRDNYVYLNGKVLPRRKLGVVHYEDITDEISPPQVRQGVADEYTETIDDKQFSIYLNQGYQTGGCPPTAHFGCTEPAKVPDGAVFVMGDNRDNSHDSRFWGYVPVAYIKGKALFIWYSGDPTQNLLRGLRPARFGHVVR